MKPLLAVVIGDPGGLGLPYLRIGIPHGSAMDIAGTGTAQHATTLKACNTAARLASGMGL